MKLTNKQLLNILEGTNLLSAAIKNKVVRLDIGTSMAVALLKKQIVPLIEAQQEIDEQILDEHCLKGEDGKRKKIPAKKDDAGRVITPEQWDLGDNLDAWKAARKELLLHEHDLETLKPMQFKDFKLRKIGDDDPEIDPDILFLLQPWLVLS